MNSLRATSEEHRKLKAEANQVAKIKTRKDENLLLLKDMEKGWLGNYSLQRGSRQNQSKHRPHEVSTCMRKNLQTSIA